MKTTTTYTPRRNAYYAGKGCECSARSRSECGCDVDWTDPRIYELQAEVERLRSTLCRALEIADEFWDNQKQAVLVYHQELADELDQLKATLNHAKK